MLLFEFGGYYPVAVPTNPQRQPSLTLFVTLICHRHWTGFSLWKTPARLGVPEAFSFKPVIKNPF